MFASTAKWAALRAILALAALETLELYSVDISTAFLNGDMEHDVYMQQPEVFKEYFSLGFTLKLVKSIYRLKQAGRQWYKKLDTVLQDMSFILVCYDNSIQIYRKENVRIIILVYVDDITITAKLKQQYQFVRDELAKHFKLHDLGPTFFLLGVHIERNRSKHSLSLSQRQYIVDVLERFEMSNCSPVKTAIDEHHKLSKAMAPQTEQERAYMQSVLYKLLVGALMYLAVTTRPDIAYAVGVLARFCSNLSMTYQKAIKYLYRYLQGTKNYKLIHAPDPSFSKLFTAYCDADHSDNQNNKRSTSRIVIKMGTGTINWASKLQPFMTLSATEAEYMTTVSTGQEIIWLRNLFTKFRYKFDAPSSLQMDNQSALSVAQNSEHHGRMKHLNLRFYQLRDIIEASHIKVCYMSTKTMPTDILTKALGYIKVQQMVGLLGLS